MIFGKHINRYYLRYLPILLLGLGALILVDYFQLILPELYRMVINGLNGETILVDGVAYEFTMSFLLEQICKPLIGIILALLVGRFLWRICFFGSAIGMETDLRSRMFDHCKDLSQQYYQVNKVGNLMTLFTNDLETVQDCFGSGIMMMFDAMFLGVLAVSKMFRMNTFLATLSLIPMACLLAMGALIGRFMMKKWDARQKAFSDLSDFAQESFSGIAVIKSFVKEFKELMAFRRLNKDNEKANVEFTQMSVLLHILVTLFVESVICVILGYGGYLVYRGVFNAGELIEFIGYFNSIVWPVMAIAELIEMRSRGKASLQRIETLLDAQPDVVDRPDVEPVEYLTGRIEFRDLTFRYPEGDYDALSNISFTIEPGESVGIIGKTGSGKTTLVDLLLRTYNVPDGTIFLDGIDINRLPIRTVRQEAAYVPQDNFLFSDTIRHNIAFSGEQDELVAVTAAAAGAAVDDSIQEFPQGYDTMLGERGVTVSGGQKQRISIARALMKDASILILDDSVSAVDVNTERTILANLRQLRRNRTTILIAHRISTIEQLDKILFMDDGRVLDVGTHEELLQRCREYRTMVELQRLEEAEVTEHV